MDAKTVYKGHVRNGVVTLDEPADLPEGAAVNVTLLKPAEPTGSTIGQRMMQFAGAARGLPPDLAENHDHYLHGQPKK